MVLFPSLHGKSMGKNGNGDRLSFLGLWNNCEWWLQPWSWKMLASWKKNYGKHRQHIKKKRHHFANKGLYSQGYGFSSSHESWAIKKAEHWRTDAFKLWCCRRLLGVPWTVRRSNQSIKGNQPWLFIGRSGAEAEGPILWPLYTKSSLVGRDPDVGKDWRQEEKRTIEDEMLGWHHWLNGHEFVQTLGDSEGQESWHAALPGLSEVWTWLRDWTTATMVSLSRDLFVMLMISFSKITWSSLGKKYFPFPLNSLHFSDLVTSWNLDYSIASVSFWI